MAASLQPVAGPSRLGPQTMGTETLVGMHPSPLSAGCLTVPPAAAITSTSTSPGLTAPGLSPGLLLEHPQSSSAPASVRPSRPQMQSRTSLNSTSDSASLCSASVHSSSRGIGGIFARRGSLLPNGRRPKSVTSNRSSLVYSHRDDASSEFEMTPVPGRARRKRIVEDHDARLDRRRAEAALSKWRKWCAEQPTNPTPADPSPLFPNRAPSLYSAPQSPRPSPPSSQHPALGDLSESARESSRRPSASTAPWNGEPVPEHAQSASESSHHLSPISNTSRSIIPGIQDIYTTESVRALRDVELAVDPEYLGVSTISLSRPRRLSTHPRLSEMDNPFSAIDWLLSRRGIRPLVLELVQALGAYIDAVWSTTNPHRPCPWAGVPLTSAVRRVSLAPNASGALPKVWRSWTVTAVQEGKRQGFLNSPPTDGDVKFWGCEIRYGLRDIDETINRRKDLGWAFGETVIRGGYGDIVPSNVMTPDGRGGNMCRLLNDLEEALWGDALPAPTDLAWEHESEFDPFSVYREGDELIGVERDKAPEVREAELRKVFGGYLPQPRHSVGSEAAEANGHGPPPASPSESQPPGLTMSPKSRYEASPRTPNDSSVAVMPDLDFSALGTLQDLTTEEKLELGRRRHQEYLERLGERKV